MDEQWILSVGIDLGTSTTKFIVSRLRLGRMSSTFSLPRYQIVERQLVYASPIYSTPLKNFDEIDVDKVSEILQAEYEKAGLQLADIKSGAVIITGETATKKNAQEIVHFLAERSGDFVVATAGADLESVLAGKGAGAESRSKKIQGTIANVDIGGGTANVAFFHRGRAVAVVTFHVGGRLIRIDEQGLIHYVSPQIKPWLERKGYALEAGRTCTYEVIKEVSRQLGKSMLDYLTGEEREISGLLVLGEHLQEKIPFEELTISGGVGQLMEEPYPTTLAEATRYGDIGPILAHELRNECLLKQDSFHLLTPEQTVRATVIGAGMQSTEISGSTVYINEQLLPLKNIPILKWEATAELSEDTSLIRNEIKRLFELGSRLFQPTSGIPFALAISGIAYCSYALLSAVASELAEQYKRFFPTSPILVVICENDMAKALGQSLALRCQGAPEVICIDQVRVEHGDYVDLGEPISGSIIPVVVKTLAFHET